MSISNRKMHNLSAWLACGPRPLAELFAYQEFRWINTPEDVAFIRSLFERETDRGVEYRHMFKAFLMAVKERGLRSCVTKHGIARRV